MSLLNTAAGPASSAPPAATGTLAAGRRRCRPAGRGEHGQALLTHSTAPLVVEIDRHGHHPLIRVSGELDVATAPLLRVMIDHGRYPVGGVDGHLPERVEVDLTRVTFADSLGLAPILDGHAAVRATSPTVRRVLQLLQHQPTAAPPAVPASHGGPPATTVRPEDTTDPATEGTSATVDRPRSPELSQGAGPPDPSRASTRSGAVRHGGSSRSAP